VDQAPTSTGRNPDVERSARPASRVRLRVLGSFAVEEGGRPLSICPGSSRVIAFLAVHGPARREVAAGRLWPDATAEHALANLRSALWRLPKADLVVADRAGLHLHPDLVIDLHESSRVAAEMVAGTRPDDLDLLTGDLLPGWYDEWLDNEREHHRLIRIRSLESASRLALDQGRVDDAHEAAALAVEAEPLRETAQRCLIAVHLAEGNRGEAAQQFDRYLRLLHSAGLVPEPSPALAAQIAPVLADPRLRFGATTPDRRC
jgi:DNA-binding SARP family transcriptional activator